MEPDRDTITCLRSVLMKPEHREWLDTIWSILDQAADAAAGTAALISTTRHPTREAPARRITSYAG